jgi:HSP20 family protein
MALQRWSPFFRDFVSLRDAVDRLFEESFVNADRLFSWTGIAARTMPLEMYETPEEVVVRALVPGVAPDKLEVSYQQGVLTLRAQTEAPTTQDDWIWHFREFGYGEMIRSISLPKAVDPDRAEATFENGILTLRLPKAEHEKPKQIKVTPVAQIAGSTK